MKSFVRVAHWLKDIKPPVLVWLSALWLLLIGWLAFFWNLGSTGLIDETEPLFAEAARQMIVRGDWITPFFDGETRFDKPALVYWLMAIGYQILGVNTWAVRLPSAIAAMGLIVLGFYTLLSFGLPQSPHSPIYPSTPYPQRGPRVPHSPIPPRWLTAGLGAALMALNIETILWARTGVSDMLLTGCMDGALFAFFLGYAQPSKPAVQARWYLAFYVLTALAILTKGPVGIVLPVLIVGSFLLYLGNTLEVLREMRLLFGGLLVAVIALPWYVLVIRANGWTYINTFFGYHNFERFTSVVNHHSAPWYFYFLVVLLGFAPWSIYLPVAMMRLQFWQRARWRASARSTQLGLFALFWFVGIFGFFTISVTKLPSYVLPLMPAASILVALLYSADASNSNQNSKLLSISGWFNIVLLLVAAGAAFFIPYLLGSDPAILNPHQLFQQSDLPVMGTAIWATTAVAIAILLMRRRWSGVLWINLLGFIAFIIFVLMPTFFLIDQARQLPLRQLAAIVRTAEQPGEEIIMIGFKKPSVVFYAQRQVNYIGSTGHTIDYIRNLVSTKIHPRSVLILSLPQNLSAFKVQQSQYQNLGEIGTYQLIRYNLL